MGGIRDGTIQLSITFSFHHMYFPFRAYIWHIRNYLFNYHQPFSICAAACPFWYAISVSLLGALASKLSRWLYAKQKKPLAVKKGAAK